MPTTKKYLKEAGLVEQLGLKAFKLFGTYKMALFFLFSMLLGAALQLTNMYGDTFLDDFRKMPAYGPGSFVVKYSTIIMSISQISETLFILSIPFFLGGFGIKKVMLFSMFAWVLRLDYFLMAIRGKDYGCSSFPALFMAWLSIFLIFRVPFC